MADLDRAKQLLREGNTYALVYAEKETFGSERGIKPLLDLNADPARYLGFSAADKIVGKAAALLYARLQIKELYAEVLSEPALLILRAHGIAFSCETMCEKIINRSGDGICPMEQVVAKTDNMNEAYFLLCEKLKTL